MSSAFSLSRGESTFHPVGVVCATRATSDLELMLRLVCWAFCCEDALLKQSADVEKANLEREGSVYPLSCSPLQFFLGLLL